jgi:hypothetical protein
LLDIGDGKVTTDETGCIQLPTDFCTIIDSQDALIGQIFLNVHKQYTNHEWLAEKVILAAKNVDIKIESQDTNICYQETWFHTNLLIRFAMLLKL